MNRVPLELVRSATQRQQQRLLAEMDCADGSWPPTRPSVPAPAVRGEGVRRVLFIIAVAFMAALVMHEPVCDQDPAQCVFPK